MWAVLTLGVSCAALTAPAQGAPTPEIVNLAPAAVAAHTAVVQVNLVSTGDAPTRVWIHWGDEDGGTNQAGWDADVPLDWQSEGPLAAALASLADVKAYYYRGYASNDFGDAWAPDTQSFTTRLDQAAIEGTNFVGVNMDFEQPGTGWSWDPHSYQAVGRDGALAPQHGALMLQAEGSGSSSSGSKACDVAQAIDIGRYREAVTNGMASFVYTVRYNRVSSSFAPVVDTAAFSYLIFYNAAGANVGTFGWWDQPGHFLIADDDPTTWQTATVSGALPPTAVTAWIRLGWYENVWAEGSGEFKGNYWDHVELGLIFPDVTPEPPSGILLQVK